MQPPPKFKLLIRFFPYLLLKSFKIKESTLLRLQCSFGLLVSKINQMISKEKKIWCEEEDQTLRLIYEDQGQKSWSVIAKRLCSQFNFPRKSAKQCRERYENHICSQGVRIQWNQEEQTKLIELHNEMGNKWSLIAQNIPGKTDNCVKNHFYSKLRKVLRKLNSIIHTYLKKEYRQINIGTLYKIVEATQQRFKEDPSCGYEVSQACREVQNRMLHISMLKEEEYQSQERVKIYSDIVRDIYAVSKMYKRKSKKIRNSAIQAPNAKRKKQRESNIIVKNVEEQGYASDSSSVFEEQEVINKENKPQIVVQQQQEGIRDMLKDHGLLKEQQQEANKSVFRFSCKSSFKSYSENNNIQSDNQFFEDSDFEKGLMTRRKGSFYRYRSGLFDDPSDRSEREGPDFTFG